MKHVKMRQINKSKYIILGDRGIVEGYKNSKSISVTGRRSPIGFRDVEDPIISRQSANT
jgi:hypothetical protein